MGRLAWGETWRKKVTLFSIEWPRPRGACNTGRYTTQFKNNLAQNLVLKKQQQKKKRKNHLISLDVIDFWLTALFTQPHTGLSDGLLNTHCSQNMLSGWLLPSPRKTTITSNKSTIKKTKQKKNLDYWKRVWLIQMNNTQRTRLPRWAFIIHFEARALSEETSGHISTSCPCARQWSALISAKVDMVWERWEGVKVLQLHKVVMCSTISPQLCCSFSRMFFFVLFI